MVHVRGMSTSSNVRSNFGATTHKQQGKPGIIRDQKTKPGTTNHDPVRSAKPPSPVQIRAAPPKSFRNSRDWVCACVRGRFLIAPKSPSNCSSFRRATSVKSLNREQLSARDLRRGGGSQNLRLYERSRNRGCGEAGPRRERRLSAERERGERRPSEKRPLFTGGGAKHGGVEVHQTSGCVLEAGPHRHDSAAFESTMRPQPRGSRRNRADGLMVRFGTWPRFSPDGTAWRTG